MRSAPHLGIGVMGHACLAAILVAASLPAAAQGPDGTTMKLRIARRPGQDEGVRGVAFAPEPGAAAWTLKLGPRGQVIIAHEGVEVVRSDFAFSAQPGQQAAGRFTVAHRSPGLVETRGAVEALGLHWQGRAFPLTPRELRVELDIVASRPMSGIGGGGLAWTLRPDTTALRGKAGPPELLADRTGWRWPVGEGQELVIRFDKPIARLDAEPGKPELGTRDVVRTSFVGDRIRSGQGRIGLTVTLPEGGRIVAGDEERYPPPDATWFREALRWDVAPVDLSFLNAEDRPAGRRGPVRVDGDRLVFADGTPARFWGANLSGPVLFSTPPANIPGQARRMAQLGYNLMRIHQHDSGWVKPNIFGRNASNSRHLDPRSLDLLDLWIKCLKDEGIYVWLDMHYLREAKPDDGVTLGRDEITRQKNRFWGFNFVNPELAQLMKEFQNQYLNHINRYTGIAYKDDPAVIGVLITNENDLTSHFGVFFLADKHNPVHKELFDRELAAFGKATGLPADKLWRTWEPGPSKYLLSELEHRFFRDMSADLRSLGVKAAIAPTSLWGKTALYSLPALTEGDVMDAHMYGSGEDLGSNPHDSATFVCWAAAAQVHGKPVTISEWNVPFPALDRFTSPLYVASIASLQGWDAPMLYNYSQVGLEPPGEEEWKRRIDKWSTFHDPAITGLMPAAALAFRRQHIRPAQKTYCLTLSPEQLFGTRLAPEDTPALRTLVEQSRVTIGMPAVKELPWLKPTVLSGDVIAVRDPHQDFLPEGAAEIRSDTGELARDWRRGVQTIDTPRTQAVSGWIGGRTIDLKDASFRFQTRKAVVVLSSIDDQPLSSSRFLLISAVGQARPSPGTGRNQGTGELPFLSEPVVGTIHLRNPTIGLELLALGPNGRVVTRSAPDRQPDGLVIRLPSGKGTHWYVLRTRQLPQAATGRAPRPSGNRERPGNGT